MENQTMTAKEAAELALRDSLSRVVARTTGPERLSSDQLAETLKEEKLQAAIKASKFPLTAKARIQHPDWDDALTWCEGVLSSGASLLAFVGPPGRGKTAMAYWASVFVLKRREGASAAWETASWLFARMRSTNQSAAKETEFDVMNAYLAYTILTIDEVGMGKGTDFEYQSLNTLICRRYDAGKKTIIISAKDRNSLDTVIDPAGHSRMNQCGGVVEFDWETFRKAA